MCKSWQRTFGLKNAVFLNDASSSFCYLTSKPYVSLITDKFSLKNFELIQYLGTEIICIKSQGDG